MRMFKLFSIFSLKYFNLRQEMETAATPVLLNSTPTQQIIEIAGTDESLEKRYCILSLQPTDAPPLQPARENNPKQPGKPDGPRQMIISQWAELAANMQPPRSKSTTHFHNSRVLSPQAETSQRIYLSGKYKDLATNIQDGGPIRSRISHGAFSNLVAAPPSQMIVPDMRSNSNSRASAKHREHSSKFRARRNKSIRASKSTIAGSQQRRNQANALVQKEGSFASTLQNKQQITGGAAASTAAYDSNQIIDSNFNKVLLQQTQAQKDNVVDITQAVQDQQNNLQMKKQNRNAQNRDLQSINVLNYVSGNDQSPQRNQDGLYVQQRKQETFSNRSPSQLHDRSAVKNYAAAALAMAYTQQTNNDTTHAISQQEIAENSSIQNLSKPLEAPFGLKENTAGADGNVTIIPIQIQMRVTPDLVKQHAGIINPDMQTQMTLERKGCTSPTGLNENNELVAIQHTCDLSGQVQRNLKVGSELRNAKRLVPLFKEMQNKISMQESVGAHQAWKTQQRQKKRKTQNRVAYKGINEVIEIKKLDTIEEFKQKQQQSAEEEASLAEVKTTNQQNNQPVDPMNELEVTKDPMDFKNIEQDQSSIEKQPVTQVAVTRNGTPIQEPAAAKLSQVEGQAHSTVLLGNNNDIIYSFILNDDKSMEKQPNMQPKSESSQKQQLVKQANQLKHQRNKIKELLNQQGYPSNTATVQQTKPTRNNGRRIILTENNLHQTQSQINLTKQGLQELHKKSDSQSKGILTSDLLQIQKMPVEQSQENSVACSINMHSNQKNKILGVIGQPINTSPSPSSQERKTRSLLTHYHNIKKQQKQNGSPQSLSPTRMESQQEQILKIRAQNDDMLDQFYQGKRKMQKPSVVSKTSTNAITKEKQTILKKSMSNKSNQIKPASLNESHISEMNHAKRRDSNSGQSPYQTFNVQTGKQSPMSSFHRQRKNKKHDLDFMRIQSIQGDSLQKKDKNKDKQNQSEHGANRGRQPIDLTKQKQKAGEDTTTTNWKNKIDVIPLSSKRTTIQHVSKGISCSLSQASDDYWLHDDVQDHSLSIGEEEDDDEQEILGEDSHVKLNSIMYPTKEALSSRRSQQTGRHKQDSKKTRKVPNQQGTQLIKQRIGNISHRGSVKRIVMQKKKTGAASTPEEVQQQVPQEFSSSEMATLQSLKINPNLNRESPGKQLQHGDSGQNSKATLKIRIKIDKNNNQPSSRSSSVNHSNKNRRENMRLLASDDENLFDLDENEAKGQYLPQQVASFLDGDAQQMASSSTLPNNMVHLNKYRGLIKQKTTSGASTLRHQSSVLTSLHPSAGNLHSNNNLASQSFLNIQDGGADRSKQWLTRVVSHQQVVHDWLNNTGTDLPEFIHKSGNLGAAFMPQSTTTNEQNQSSQLEQYLFNQSTEPLNQARATTQVDQPDHLNQSLLDRQFMVGNGSMFNTQYDDVGMARAGVAYRNDLVEDMDSDLVTQIRDLSREYRRQSREQFKRYQYTGNKKPVIRSGSAAAYSRSQQQKYQNSQQNVYASYKEGSVTYLNASISQSKVGGAKLSNTNWSPDRYVSSNYVLEGELGGNYTDQDYLSKLQMGTYLNTPMNQSHCIFKGGPARKNSYQAHKVNRGSNYTQQNRKSLLQPLISQTQKQSQTTINRSNVLVRNQYNNNHSQGYTNAGVVKQHAASKQRTPAGRMKITGTKFSTAMVSMGTASTSGQTSKNRQGSNKSPFNHCLRNSALTQNSQKQERN